MIDKTNTAIEELEAEVRRENDRRYTFYRMLRATDLQLWRLEEMNRDGVKTIPKPVREELKETTEQCQEPFRDSERVQETLDSVFAVQERLFRWHHPDLAFEDEDDLDRASPLQGQVGQEQVGR